MAAPETREPEPASRSYSSQGLELRYLEWGDPSAPLLLLVHGICEHAHSWDQMARALCRDWRIIAPDLRGHGDSAWSPDRAYLSAYYLLDIAALIESLGTERIGVIAHSLGGNVMARFSAVFPDRVSKLVLIEGLGPSPEAFVNWERQGPVQRTRAWIETQRAALAKPARVFESLVEVEKRLIKSNPRLSAPMAAHLAQHAVRPSGGGYVWKHDGLVNAFAPEDFSLPGPQFWQQIVIPTLLFQGKESWTTNPEIDGRAAHFKNRRTHLIEAAGHWVHLDQFEAVIGPLQAFLAE